MGYIITVNVDLSHTIVHDNRKTQHKEGIPLNEHSVIFVGQSLVDEYTIFDNIQKELTVYLVLVKYYQSL